MGRQPALLLAVVLVFCGAMVARLAWLQLLHDRAQGRSHAEFFVVDNPATLNKHSIAVPAVSLFAFAKEVVVVNFLSSPSRWSDREIGTTSKLFAEPLDAF